MVRNGVGNRFRARRFPGNAIRATGATHIQTHASVVLRIAGLAGVAGRVWLTQRNKARRAIGKTLKMA